MSDVAVIPYITILSAYGQLCNCARVPAPAPGRASSRLGVADPDEGAAGEFDPPVHDVERSGRGM